VAQEASRLIELGAGHLSVYDLVVEEGTRIAAAIGRSELETPGEDEAWEERVAAEEIISSAGFRRYEVSNYAPPGSECAHNLAYWRMDSYVGAGPGAVSTVAGVGGTGYADGGSLRIEESRDLDSYPDEAAANAREQRIAPRDAAFESIMMGFRTRFGLGLDSFGERFGVELSGLVPKSLAAWSDRLGPGWGADRRLALDDRGLDLLNRFLADCLAEIDAARPRIEDMGR
jgi:oxygen-independent coproporphyrinogen-3 oxidase